MHVSSEEWSVAEYRLKSAPNGTILPYSALLKPSGEATERSKAHRATLFNTYQSSEDSPKTNTFHSFIKIEGEIFAIAQGKSPEALIGKGHFGKIKFIQNKKGEVAVVKIEEERLLNEATVLKDQKLPHGAPLSKGTVQRLDKEKYYTHLAYLGVSVRHLLMNYQLEICSVEPNGFLQNNTIYLYAEGKKLYCKFKENVSVEPLSIKHLELPLLKDYPLIEKGINDVMGDIEKLKTTLQAPEKNYEPRLLRNQPLDREIMPNKLYLYPSDKGLSYAFLTKDNNVIRVTSDMEYPFIMDALNDRLFDESLKKKIHSALALYPHDALFPLQLDDNRRLQIAIDICLLVDSLHRGLSSISGTAYAHRDIKPENIVIDAQGECHLIDFGFSEAPPHTYSSIIRGTPMYLPLIPPYSLNPTNEQCDLIALKRTLLLPAELHCLLGEYFIPSEDRKNLSVLSDEIVDKYKLSSYLNTSDSAKDTALTLAAILIAAQLDLGIDYDTLQKNSDQSFIIVEYYKKQRKSPTLKKELLAALQDTHQLPLRAALIETGCFETPQHYAQHEPVKYVAAYFKKAIASTAVTDIETSRALIEAIEANFSMVDLVRMTKKEAFQIRGVVRAKQLDLDSETTRLLAETRFPHASLLIQFANSKAEAEIYCELCHILSNLEAKLPILAPEQQQATSDLIDCLQKSMTDLKIKENRNEQLDRFHKSIMGAITSRRSALDHDETIKKDLDFLCTALNHLSDFCSGESLKEEQNANFIFFKPAFVSPLLPKVETQATTIINQNVPGNVPEVFLNKI